MGWVFVLIIGIITDRVRSTRGGYIFSLFVCSHLGGRVYRGRPTPPSHLDLDGGPAPPCPPPHLDLDWGALTHPAPPTWTWSGGRPAPHLPTWTWTGGTPPCPPTWTWTGGAMPHPHPPNLDLDGGPAPPCPPSHFTWMGGPAPPYLDLDRGHFPPPPPQKQHSVYLLCGSRYASCVHAGGLSCNI